MATIAPARPQDAALAAPLIHASVHELMHFMLGTEATVEHVLQKLFRKPRGHFSHTFTTGLYENNTLVGLELGYTREQLAAQELPGSINLMLASPLTRWPHLVLTTPRTLSGYVMPPSPGAYYINNLAVSHTQRGKGFGQQLLEAARHKAKNNGQTLLELDVTATNDHAIKVYTQYGFKPITRAGTPKIMPKLMETHGLPPLQRMQLTL